MVRAVSLLLAVMFCLGTTTFAFASPKAKDAPLETNSFEMLNSLGKKQTTTINDKAEFEIKADKVTDNSAVITWTSDTVYLSYIFCRYDVINNQWREVSKTDSCAMRLTDLVPNTNYRYCVMSTSSRDVLGVVEFTTSTKTPTLELVGFSSKEVELKIGNVDKRAYVEIYRSEDDGEFKRVGKTKRGATEYTDEKIEPGKNYTYKVKTVLKKGLRKLVSANSNSVDVITMISHALPAVDGTTKTYAYYTAVTAVGSPQYRLLNSPECTTDPETGIRMYDGCYCVALGSFYGSTIGTKYRITLSSGSEFDVILCDQKADIHTDANHQYAVVNNDILEFYVEGSKIPSVVDGDYGVLEKFKGGVVAIEEYVQQDTLMYY